LPEPDPIGADRLEGRGDDLYAALLDAHAGLSAAQSHRLDARLVLLLLNELGDVDRALAVIHEARRGLDEGGGLA